MKRLLIMLLAIFVFPYQVNALDWSNDICESTTKYIYDNVPNPTVNSIGGEWAVIPLAKANLGYTDWFNVYKENALNYVASVGSNILNVRKSTDNSRVVLALSSIGIDASNFGGYNLVEPLTDLSYVSKQGINGVIYALQALNSYSFDVSFSSEEYINYFEDKQLSDGGWSLSGKSSDADVTAMVLQALAPYKDTNEAANILIEQGLTALSNLQNNDGSYSSFGTVNSESCSQVIIALSYLNLKNDERFIKNGSSVYDTLLRFYNPQTGAFKHSLDGDDNEMATEQAALALVTYFNTSRKQQTSDDDHTPIDLYISFINDTSFDLEETIDLYYVNTWTLDNVLSYCNDNSKIKLKYTSGEFFYNGNQVLLDVYLDGEKVDVDCIPATEVKQNQTVEFKFKTNIKKYSFDTMALPSKIFVVSK